MVRDKGFSHHDSKEALRHRGQVECAAGGGVCAVFGANPHAGATVANGSGGGPNPRPSLRRNTYSRKVEEQRAR
jgi:class 3 adenylate cyclase